MKAQQVGPVHQHAFVSTPVKWVAEVQTSKDGKIYALSDDHKTSHEVLAQNEQVEEVLDRLGGSVGLNVSIEGNVQRRGNRDVVLVDKMELQPVTVKGDLKVRKGEFFLAVREAKIDQEYELVASSEQAKVALGRLEKSSNRQDVRVTGPKVLMLDTEKNALSRLVILAEEVESAIRY